MSEEIIEEATPEFSLRDLYFVIFRHKLKVFVVACVLFFVAAVFALLFTKTIYRSEAKLFVKAGRESVVIDPAAATGGTARIGRNRGEEIASVIEIIKSREIAEKVFDKLGPNFFSDNQASDNDIEKSIVINSINNTKAVFKLFFEKAKNLFIEPVSEEAAMQWNRESIINMLLGQLEVKQVRNTSMLLVAHESGDAWFSYKVVELFINFYLDKHVSLYFTDTSYQFLQQQTEKFRTDLELVEQNIRNFQNKTDDALSSSDRSILLNRIGEAKQSIRETESDIASSRARAKLLQAKLELFQKMQQSQSSGDLSVQSFDEVHQRISELKLNEQELLLTYTDQSIPVQNIRRQIREAQKLLPEITQGQSASQALPVSFEIRQQLQMELIAEQGNVSSFEARVKELKKQLIQVRNEYRRMNSSEIVFTRLQRDKKMFESSYQNYSDSFEQASIDRALKMEKISNISIVQAPVLPVVPVKSKRKLILIGGLIGGVIAGLVLAFFLENLDHTLKRPEDIKKRLNLANFVSIPLLSDSGILNPDMSEVENLRKVPGSKTNESGRKRAAASEVNMDIRKHFESLLNRILFVVKEPAKMPHVVALTSCYQGEGVSTVAANLAVMMARYTKGKVLLLDMSRLRLDKDFDAGGSFPELGDMIAMRESSSDEALPSSRVDNVYMLQNSNTGKSMELAELQRLWSGEYEFVVLDMPPVFDDASVASLARIAEEVILVVEAEQMRWEVVRQAREILIDSNANLIGTVLNKRKYYIPSWLYRTL